MARTKNTSETQPDTVSAPVANDAPKDGATPIVAENDIPESVKPILKVFKRYEQLWIDKSGGVFVTKTNEQREAIIYKNPYA